MKRIKPAQQGTADGLCGLYGLLNFLQNSPQFYDDGSTAYQQLILAADRCGVLTPWHLCEGFQWFDLLEIFNVVSRNYRMAFVARPIDAIAKGLGSGAPSDVVKSIIEAGGAAMIHINAGGHWVLAHAIKDGGFLVDDSGQAPKPYTLKGNGLTKRGTDTVEGLAILPINSEMSSWP